MIVEFQNEVKTLIPIITENRIMCANGPVHALPSIPLHIQWELEYSKFRFQMLLKL